MTKKHIFIYLFMIFRTMIFPETQTNAKLRVFVEGSTIDFDYIRNTIKFVDFVNDPKISDIHIIISKQSTGGGGNQYTLSYYGKRFDRVGDIHLSCNTFSFQTQEKTRTILVSTLKAGLVPYVNENGGIETITIDNQTTEDKEDQADGQMTAMEDPWRNWVFKIGGEGGFGGEEQKQNFDYTLSFEANKVTDRWKMKNEYQYDRDEDFIEKNNNGGKRTIHTRQIEQELDMETVFSINDWWSWGMFFEGKQNTYRNYQMSLFFNTGIQFNVFPWSESDRRVFTFGYLAGPSWDQYYERTILDKNREWLWSEKVEMNLRRIEVWGEIEATIGGGHYFPNFRNYYYEADVDLSLRITKGFSLTFETRAESIHNQRYLPASELSDEELLLDTRKLPTSFEYSGQIGIEFQFGSIFNNVVNERF